MARRKIVEPPKQTGRREKPGVVRLTIELPEAIAGRLMQYCAFPRRKYGSVIAEALTVRLAGFYTVGDRADRAASLAPEPAPAPASAPPALHVPTALPGAGDGPEAA